MTPLGHNKSRCLHEIADLVDLYLTENEMSGVCPSITYKPVNLHLWVLSDCMEPAFQSDDFYVRNAVFRQIILCRTDRPLEVDRKPKLMGLTVKVTTPYTWPARCRRYTWRSRESTREFEGLNLFSTRIITFKIDVSLHVTSHRRGLVWLTKSLGFERLCRNRVSN